MMKSLRAFMFSGVGSMGIAGGSGALVLLLQPHGASSSVLVRPATQSPAVSRGNGNDGLMIPRSFRQFLLRNTDLSSWVTCSMCLQGSSESPLACKVTGIAPRTVSFLPSATFNEMLDFNSSCLLTPSFFKMSGPAHRVEHPVSATP